MKKGKCCEGNPFVAITGAAGGIMLVIVVLFLAMAKEQLPFLAATVWGLVVLGVFACFFAFLAQRKKK